MFKFIFSGLFGSQPSHGVVEETRNPDPRWDPRRCVHCGWIERKPGPQNSFGYSSDDKTDLGDIAFTCQTIIHTRNRLPPFTECNTLCCLKCKRKKLSDNKCTTFNPQHDCQLVETSWPIWCDGLFEEDMSGGAGTTGDSEPLVIFATGGRHHSATFFTLDMPLTKPSVDLDSRREICIPGTFTNSYAVYKGYVEISDNPRRSGVPCCEDEDRHYVTFVSTSLVRILREKEVDVDELEARVTGQGSDCKAKKSSDKDTKVRGCERNDIELDEVRPSLPSGSHGREVGGYDDSDQQAVTERMKDSGYVALSSTQDSAEQSAVPSRNQDSAGQSAVPSRNQDSAGQSAVPSSNQDSAPARHSAVASSNQDSAPARHSAVASSNQDSAPARHSAVASSNRIDNGDYKRDNEEKLDHDSKQNQRLRKRILEMGDTGNNDLPTIYIQPPKEVRFDEKMPNNALPANVGDSGDRDSDFSDVGKNGNDNLAGAKDSLECLLTRQAKKNQKKKLKRKEKLQQSQSQPTPATIGESAKEAAPFAFGNLPAPASTSTLQQPHPLPIPSSHGFSFGFPQNLQVPKPTMSQQQSFGMPTINGFSFGFPEHPRAPKSKLQQPQPIAANHGTVLPDNPFHWPYFEPSPRPSTQ